MGKYDFLSLQAPENYVAGLGRGATGFTTRSDLGPAREGPSEEQIKEALAKRAEAAGIDTQYRTKNKDQEDNDEYDDGGDPENEVGLFAGGSYDREDDEADEIYQAVDEKMAKRRKARREAREQEDRDEYERNNPKISQQFADLKRALTTISDEEWASIPEVGDLTGKNKRVKANAKNRYYAVPDSVIASARDSMQMETTVSDDQPVNGESTDGTATNFADIGAARERTLNLHLQQYAKSSGTETVNGTLTNVDAKEYQRLMDQTAQGELNIGDINRLRGLIESLIKTNPKHAPAWIVAARLEEVAGKHVAARNLVARGCEHCPKSEDIWIENIRLNENHNAKIIAANALKNNDKSIRLWTVASDLEKEPRAKKRVLRQALDHNPQSVDLWKQAVNLEESETDAKLMLSKAVEIVPLSVELWLALARLEDVPSARTVLNNARRAIPTSHEIWVYAIKLQEQINETEEIHKVVAAMIKALKKQQAMLKREDWIAQAKKCEEEGFPLSAASIVKYTIGWQLEKGGDDLRQIWMQDAASAVNEGMYATARAIFEHLLQRYPTSKHVWERVVEFEKEHGTKERLMEVLHSAVEACPYSEELWLELIRETWERDGPQEGRQLIGKAFAQNPGNEKLWLSAVRMEAKAGALEQASDILEDARQQAGTDRVWIKSVAFERERRNIKKALSLVNDALDLFPEEAKLYMMKGQIYENDFETIKVTEARNAYAAGMRQCPQSVPLWLLAARLEEQQGVVVKARSILDRARLAIPKDPLLWTESVRIERRAGNLPSAQNLMSRALQEVPSKKAGLLWQERIWHLEPRTQRKPLVVEAIKKNEGDPILLYTAARIFWAERKLDKAATWFEKALTVDPQWGDSFAWYLKFLSMHGTAEKVDQVTGLCVKNEPRFGEIWPQVSKDPKNAGKGAAEVLELVIARLE